MNIPSDYKCNKCGSIEPLERKIFKDPKDGRISLHYNSKEGLLCNNCNEGSLIGMEGASVWVLEMREEGEPNTQNKSVNESKRTSNLHLGALNKLSKYRMLFLVLTIVSILFILSPDYFFILIGLFLGYLGMGAIIFALPKIVYTKYIKKDRLSRSSFARDALVAGLLILVISQLLNYQKRMNALSYQKNNSTQISNPSN